MQQPTTFELAELFYTTCGSTEDVRYPPYEKYQHMFNEYQAAKKHFQFYNHFPVVHLLDEMLEWLGRYPTEQEYIAEALDRVLPIYKKDSRRMKEFKGTPLEEEAFILMYSARSAATYASRMCEEYTMAQMKSMYPGATFYSDVYMDTVMGVDIAMALEGELYYIHIQSKSNNNTEVLAKKAQKYKFPVQEYNRKTRVTTLDWCYYERDFRNHIIFEYEWKNTKFVTLHNGIPTFDKKYIKNKIDMVKSGVFSDQPALERVDKPNSIHRLIESLIKDKIVKRGYEINPTPAFASLDDAKRGMEHFKTVWQSLHTHPVVA